MGKRLLAIAFAVSLLAGCSSAADYLTTGPATAVGATSDVNPQNPATLRDGGDLRLALTEFPSNFNTLHIDGNSADVGGMLKATMPRAFVIGPDGSTTVDTDYFSSVELTGTNPQVVTYTINPKATWSDGTPLSWEDIASQIHATSGADKNFAIAGTNGSERVKSVTRGVDDRQVPGQLTAGGQPDPGRQASAPHRLAELAGDLGGDAARRPVDDEMQIGQLVLCFAASLDPTGVPLAS